MSLPVLELVSWFMLLPELELVDVSVRASQLTQFAYICNKIIFMKLIVKICN